MYRGLLALTVLLWLALTAVLVTNADANELPLISLRFSSLAAVGWLTSGLGLLLLIARGLLRSRWARWIEHYETLSMYLDEAVFICNARGRVRWQNTAARDLLDSAVVPDSLRSLLKRAHSSRRIAIQTLTFKEGIRFSVQALPLDRQHYALICRALQPSGTQNTFYENFIRRIVHDMRNPLAGIIGHAANMSQSATVEPEVWRKSATTIENEAQRLARLVDSMLFDARLAYVPLEMQSLDLADVLEEALYAHDERAEREGKSLAMDTPTVPMRLEADRDLLTRAFENLIDNSLKYSGEGGRLHIRLQSQPNVYLIEFADNGEGIPPEYLPDRIFEPLVRARSHGSGSGLGLSVARKIFEIHGGTITVQSQIGIGTTMTVRLPRPSTNGVTR